MIEWGLYMLLAEYYITFCIHNYADTCSSIFFFFSFHFSLVYEGYCKFRMQTSGAVAAAHILLQSAEAALPKQKKSSVVTEFKHAKVAHKRRSKAHKEEKGKLLK